jgi:hypothetical protein
VPRRVDKFRNTFEFSPRDCPAASWGFVIETEQGLTRVPEGLGNPFQVVDELAFLRGPKFVAFKNNRWLAKR